jgi:transposase
MVSMVRYRRARAALTSAGANTVEMIARLVPTSPDPVREMIHQLNEVGMDLLDQTRAGGRRRSVRTDDKGSISRRPRRTPLAVRPR